MGRPTFSGRRFETRAWVGILAIALVCGEARIGSAASDTDTKKACAEGYEGYQVFRKKSELKAAHQALLSCVRSECPAAVQRECAEWLAELDRTIPSVVLEATVDGLERTDVAVEMDGKPVADRLDGKAVEVDPGSHTFRFRFGSLPPVEKVVLLKEGDKLRVVSAALGKAPKPAETPAAAAAPAPAPIVPMHRPVPAAVYVLGGLSLLSFGSFAAFAVMGNSKESEIRASNCEPFCADVDQVRTQYLIADISLGVGVASALASGIVYLARPSRPIESPSDTHVRPTANAGSLSWAVAPTAQGGVGAVLQGAF